MSLLKDTAFNAGSSVITIGSRLLVTVMLARSLSQAAYGEFVFTQFTMDVVFLVCSFGINGLYTRYIPALSVNGQGADLRRLYLAGLGSFVLCVVSFLVFEAVTGKLSPATLLSVAFWCATYLGLNYLNPILQGNFRYDSALLGNVTFSLLCPVLIFLAPWGRSLGGAALAMGVAYLCNALVVAAYSLAVRKPPVTVSPAAIPVSRKGIVAYSANVWLVTLISGLVWSRGELAVLKPFVTSEQVAVYAAALTLAGIGTQGAQLLTGALTPHVAAQWQSGAYDRIIRLTNALTQVILCLTAAAAIGMIACGDVVISLLLGTKYAATYPILCILSMASVSTCSGCAILILQIETNARYGLITNVVALVILLSVSAALSPVIGVFGVSLGRFLAQNTVTFMVFWRLRKVGGMERLSRKLALGYAAAIAIVLGFWGFNQLLHPILAVRIVTGLAFAGAALAAVRRIIGVKFTALRGLV